MVRGILRRQWPLLALSAVFLAVALVTYVRQRPHLQDNATMDGLENSSAQIARAEIVNVSDRGGRTLRALPDANRLVTVGNFPHPGDATDQVVLGEPSQALHPGMVYLSPDTDAHRFVIAARSPTGRVYSYTYAIDPYGQISPEAGFRLVSP